MAAAKTTTARRTTAKPTTAKPASRSRSTAQKPQVDPIAQLQEQMAALAGAIANLAGATPAEPEPVDTDGVQTADGYSAPSGQPDLSDTASDPSSAKQKRYLADLLMWEIEAGGKKPTAKQIAAWKAYQQALNLLLVSLGVDGAASLEKGDAQIDIDRIVKLKAKATAAKRSATRRK